MHMYTCTHKYRARGIYMTLVKLTATNHDEAYPFDGDDDADNNPARIRKSCINTIWPRITTRYFFVGDTGALK